MFFRACSCDVQIVCTQGASELGHPSLCDSVTLGDLSPSVCADAVSRVDRHTTTVYSILKATVVETNSSIASVDSTANVILVCLASHFFLIATPLFMY